MSVVFDAYDPSGPSGHLPSVAGEEYDRSMPIETHPLTPHIGGRLTGIDARKPLTPDEVDASTPAWTTMPCSSCPARTSATSSSSPSRAISARSRRAPTRRCAARSCASTPPSPTSPTSTRKARSWRATTSGAWPRWATGCGTPMPRSASCRPSYSILSGRIVATDGGNTEFADMRAAYDALDAATKAEIEDLVCEHSLIYLARPARLHRLPARRARGDEAGAPPAGAHASRLGPQVALPVGPYRHHPRLAAARGDGLHPRPDGARHPARSSSTRTHGRSTTS